MFDGAGGDAWERKTRPPYRESELSRRLLQKARDPNATAPELDAVADEALAHLNAQWYPANACNMVVEAVAAHPNTPPARFNDLFLRTPVARRAFCRNPIAPFLLLETPNFVANLHEYSQRELLCEADLPPAFARLLASGHAVNRAPDIEETARMHVAVAGEAQTRAEWEIEARSLYRKIAREQTDSEVLGWIAELIEIGYLPSWANGKTPPGEPYLYRGDAKGARSSASLSTAEMRNRLQAFGEAALDAVKETVLVDPGLADAVILEAIMRSSQPFPREWLLRFVNTPTAHLIAILKYSAPNHRRLARRHPNAPQNAREISRRAFADQWGNGVSALFEKYDRDVATRQQALLTLASALYRKREHQDIFNRVASQFWTERFEAVWLAPHGDAPLSGPTPGCTGRELLDHLSRDPNRIVRGAAQTRLADPNYRFSL